MNCPECQLDTVILFESRKRADGARRRRYKCLTCDYRWTEYQANACEPRVRLVKRNSPAQRRLTEQEAKAVMLSSCSSASLAAKYNMSRQAIDLVRYGKTYKNVYKRLQDKGCFLRSSGRLHCEQCVHWLGDGGCDFGFPDAGGDFATDCYLFRQL